MSVSGERNILTNEILLSPWVSIEEVLCISVRLKLSLVVAFPKHLLRPRNGLNLIRLTTGKCFSWGGLLSRCDFLGAAFLNSAFLSNA